MSGGFFRGTSADQDTRFSNKQAKLLKSQKFPPELEHLVDMTKVKMDVIRPWIATRATEILGFEDEVLINFIYGLLDVKLVDGKTIQIQLTGFMEKNTGKFMKELWVLLLSAQNNVSGVPQQFLDAKEEETRKKKAETDTIASEIQKRREPQRERERERERKSRFEGEADVLRSVNVVPESVPRHSRGRSSSIAREEEREANGRQGSRAINGRSRSPQPNVRSPSPYRSTTSPTRSTKKTIARSRSHSGEEPKSRSVSVSSQSHGRSVSPERQYESPARRSLSPERRYRSPRRSSSPRRRRAPPNTESPLRRRSPHLRRRSTSRHRSPPYRQRSPRARQRSPPSPRRKSPSLSLRRIPSPPRRGSVSPLHHRSPLPSRRRSPLPLRRRSPSPLRHRSPSPLRRRSRTPLRRRSPSPRRHRSPFKARRRSPSPLRRRSPIRHRSPSPWRRSPLRGSPNRRRRSLVRSPINHPVDSHSSPQQRKRGHSPYRSRSPLYQTRRNLSRERGGHFDGHSSRRHRDEHDSQRTHEQNSPVSHDLDIELDEHAGSGQKASDFASRKVPISVRSPQRDVGNQNDYDKVAAAITEDSPSQPDSPANARKLNSRITRRFHSLSKSPVRQTRAKMPRRDSPGTSREEKETSRAREVLRHKIDSSGKRSDNSQRDTGLKRPYIDDHGPESNSPDRVSPTQSPASRGRPVNSKKSSGHRSYVDLPERHSQQVSYSSDDNGYDPKRVREERGSLGDVHNRQRSAKHHPKDAPVLEEKAHNEKPDGYGVNDGKRPRSKEHGEPHQELESIQQNVDKSIQHDSKDYDSENSDKHHMEKRGHRRSDKRKRVSDEGSESDSQIDDRREAKRKRKDEKRLRKEEKRRRREEKHRKRLEHRVKQKVKSMDTVTPPLDFEGNDNDSDNSDVDANTRKKFHPFDADEIESEQKKLEIELRKKALESLRAKKAISH